MPDKISILKATREGGMVQRCHTLPHHGSYSVAEHTYGVCQLIMTFHPSPTVPLLRAALNHDVAERWIGDLPTTAKWLSPDLKYAMATAEEAVELAYDLHPNSLTDDERRWLRAADLMELWLWAHEQVAQGGLRATLVISNIDVWLKERAQVFLPDELRELYETYHWTFLPEQLPTT